MPDVAVAERTLPHNLEAERSVLGAILLHNDAFNLAAEVIDARDFFRDAHRRIFDKMVQARPSAATRSIWSRSRRSSDARASSTRSAGPPTSPRSSTACRARPTSSTTRGSSRRRRPSGSLIFSANKILATAYEAEEEADVILDQAEHAIFAIADDKVRDGFVSLRDLAQSSLDTIEKLHARKELITGVPTGFTDLDEMTSGLQPSDLIIVAARPSMGKTSLVLNIAQHVGTKTDMTVGIFSLEMSKEQLFLRMLTAEARIDAHRLRGGFLGERDWGRLSQAIGTLSEAKIFIDDTPSIGVLEMRAKCRRLAAEHGLHLVIIDYIQLMQGRGRFENRTLELASISRSLKGLAKELNVPDRRALAAESRARSRAPTTGRSCRTCASRAPSSRTPTSSSSSTARICTPTRAQPPTDDAGRRRADHRQAAQRADRRRQARVHPRVHPLREPRPGGA